PGDVATYLPAGAAAPASVDLTPFNQEFQAVFTHPSELNAAGLLITYNFNNNPFYSGCQLTTDELAAGPIVAQLGRALITHSPNLLRQSYAGGAPDLRAAQVEFVNLSSFTAHIKPSAGDLAVRELGDLDGIIANPGALIIKVKNDPLEQLWRARQDHEKRRALLAERYKKGEITLQAFEIGGAELHTYMQTETQRYALEIAKEANKKAAKRQTPEEYVAEFEKRRCRMTCFVANDVGLDVLNLLAAPVLGALVFYFNSELTPAKADEIKQIQQVLALLLIILPIAFKALFYCNRTGIENHHRYTLALARDYQKLVGEPPAEALIKAPPGGQSAASIRAQLEAEAARIGQLNNSGGAGDTSSATAPKPK
ncbi:MAG TPA: hypothetical protein VD770_00905, partial [Coxiellaceae bacterium]|nr:hypothetical protein [Coxiellaceae bacterium]